MTTRQSLEPMYDQLGSPWGVGDTVRLLGAGRPGYDLTVEQRAAVGAPLEPGLVLAGAGSGKTEVMAARVVHLVAAGLVRPEQVLGLTFTTKATASLADRIRSGLERLRTERAAGGAPVEALDGEPTVSTYNGYGARLVAEQGLRLGVEPGSRLATEGMRWQLTLRVVRQWSGGLDLDVTPATAAARVGALAGELADHLTTGDAVRDAHRAVRGLVEASPKPGSIGTEVEQTVVAREQLLSLVEEYERLKRRYLLLDYGDQIAVAARLAEIPAVRDAERAQFRVVLLDEYQDTGVAQRVMLQRLYADGHPVTAVGDPAQSIYAFRGASVSNILRFPTHFVRADGSQACIHPLLTNFRSGGAVLEVANRIVAGLPLRGQVEAPVLRPRPGRELVPGAASGEGAAVPTAGEVTAALLDDAEAEASWVREQLVRAVQARQALHSRSCPRPGCAGWHEAAVLCRKRSQFGLLRQALEQASVPVEIVGLGGLLDAPEVVDVVAVLRVLHDPTSNGDLIRLLTGARWRIGPRDLDALGTRARLLARPDVMSGPAAGAAAPDGGAGLDDADAEARTTALLLAAVDAGDSVDVGSLADALDQLGRDDLRQVAPLSDEARDRLRDLRALLEQLRHRAAQPLADLVADVERALGLDVELEATPRAVLRGGRANLLAFLDVAAGFVGVEGETHLGAFLASLDAAEDAEDGYDIGTPSPADAVKLMTVHAAKGLEWDVVSIPGLSGGGQGSVFPSRRPSPRWPVRADRVPWQVRGDRDDLPEWDEATNAGWGRYKEACNRRDGEEERRLAYVAVTRARSALLCSGYWWGPTAKSSQSPMSPFLAEVLETCTHGAGRVDVLAPEPGEGVENPLLAAARGRETAWPPPIEVDAAVARAAGAVRSAIRGELRPATVLVDLEANLVTAWARDADLLLRERAERGGGDLLVPVPDALSVSDLVTLTADPERLARRIARPVPERPAPAARRGTAFHAWAEARSGQRALLGEDEVPGAGDEPGVLADGTTANGAGAPAAVTLEQLQAGFLASPYGRREPVEVEVPFELVLGGHLVRGRMDAVYAAEHGPEPGEPGPAADEQVEVEVVDYKTGARPVGAAARAAAVQLACYREAWAEISGLPPGRVGAAFLYVADAGGPDGGVVRPTLPTRRELLSLLDALPVAGQEEPDIPVD